MAQKSIFGEEAVKYHYFEQVKVDFGLWKKEILFVIEFGWPTCDDNLHVQIQSTIFITKSKELSEILLDIHTLTYQICKIEEKINQTTPFHKWVCNLTP